MARPQLPVNENFPALPTSLDIITKTRLQQKRCRIPIRDCSIVSTAISGTGWLATATPTEVRVYNNNNIDEPGSAEKLGYHAIIPLDMSSKAERIKAIALSNDLLAVVTHLRLIVYDYHDLGRVQPIKLYEVCIDQKDTWTPRCVSILQVKTTDADTKAVAWIAVGGQGVNAIKLYQCSRRTGWNHHYDFQLILKCPHTNGWIRRVGFSMFMDLNSFVVFSVTSDNRIVCWDIHLLNTGSPISALRCEINGIAIGNAHSHRGKVSSVAVFRSPSGRAYILCTVDQKYGSSLLRSFIAPLKTSEASRGIHHPQWRPLPESAVGRNITSAAVSSNGRYLVTIEDDIMKLLPLRGALGGGLTTCAPSIQCKTSLKDCIEDSDSVSIALKESGDLLEVTAVDVRGHVLFARIRVFGMPEATFPPLQRESIGPGELSSDLIVRELSGKELGGRARADSTIEAE